MSHTPGPWRYDSGKIWTPKGWWVASLYEDMEEDIKRANGLLLASAPDLLSFAVSYYELFNGKTRIDKALHQTARAAIAKARGEK